MIGFYYVETSEFLFLPLPRFYFLLMQGLFFLTPRTTSFNTSQKIPFFCSTPTIISISEENEYSFSHKSAFFTPPRRLFFSQTLFFFSIAPEQLFRCFPAYFCLFNFSLDNSYYLSFHRQQFFYLLGQWPFLYFLREKSFLHFWQTTAVSWSRSGQWLRFSSLQIKTILHISPEQSNSYNIPQTTAVSIFVDNINTSNADIMRACVFMLIIMKLFWSFFTQQINTIHISPIWFYKFFWIFGVTSPTRQTIE